MKFLAKWMELENINLNEVTQIQKYKYDQCLSQSSLEKTPLTVDGNRCRNAQTDITQRENLKETCHLYLSPQNSCSPMEEVMKENKSQSGWETPGEQSSLIHLGKVHANLQRLNQQSPWACTMSSACIVYLLA